MAPSTPEGQLRTLYPFHHDDTTRAERGGQWLSGPVFLNPVSPLRHSFENLTRRLLGESRHRSPAAGSTERRHDQPLMTRTNVQHRAGRLGGWGEGRKEAVVAEQQSGPLAASCPLFATAAHRCDSFKRPLAIPPFHHSVPTGERSVCTLSAGASQK